MRSEGSAADLSIVPDEFRGSGITRVTADDVDEYERRAGFDPASEVELLVTLGLDEQETLIDYGCGPGGFTVAAARVAGRVIAVDPSPVMVGHVRERAAAQGLDQVDVVQAGFLTHAYEGEPVGFVFTRNALHHLPDVWKMEALRRMATILRPGGVLRLRDLVYSFPAEQMQHHIDAWIGTTADEADGWSRDVLVAHVRDEFSTYGWILEGMLDRAGFTIDDAWSAESGVYAAYTCVRR